MDTIREFSLAAVVSLSLVLSLAAGAWRARCGARTAWLRTVWAGQALGAAAGLWVVVAPVHPEAGAFAALVLYLLCLAVLRRQLRPAGPACA